MKKNHLTNRTLPSILLALTIILTLVGVQPAQAKANAEAAITWYVSTAGNDANDCATTTTPCGTINGAIGKAATGDTILVAVGVYTGTDQDVVLVTKPTTLSGGWDAGFTTQTGLSTIDAQNARRGLRNMAGPVSIQNFRIQNGNLGGANGAGVYNDGILTITNSIIRNNVTRSWGGGIYVSGGTSLTVNNTLITDNQSRSSGAMASMSGGEVTINNSTVSNNYGSGIYFSGRLILNNSTISGNSYNGLTTSSQAVINNSTITDNENRGVYNSGGILVVRNSIIAGNHGDTDCWGTITSSSYNLIGIGNNCTLTASTGDIIGTINNPLDPRLAPLANNGGPTFTHALLPESLAYSAGNPAVPGSDETACLATDQRGIARPVGFRCDMGAYEDTTTLNVPAPKLPNTNTTIKTPAYRWTRVAGATAYRYQVITQTNQRVYTKLVSELSCQANLCANTPTEVLPLNSYKWRVQANVDGVWKNYSAFMPFTVFTPQVGFWQGTGGEYVEFYVAPDRTKIKLFTLYATVYACGVVNQKIIHGPVPLRKNGTFAATGSFALNGVFESATKAYGQFTLLHYHLPGCGYISGGPFKWIAAWKNADKLEIQLEIPEGAVFTVTPENGEETPTPVKPNLVQP